MNLIRGLYPIVLLRSVLTLSSEFVRGAVLLLSFIRHCLSSVETSTESFFKVNHNPWSMNIYFQLDPSDLRDVVPEEWLSFSSE